MSVEWVDEEIGAPRGAPADDRGWRSRVPRWWPAAALLVVGAVAGLIVGRATAPDETPPAGPRVSVSGLVVIRTFVTVGGTGAARDCTSYGRANSVQSGTPLVISDARSRVLGATLLRAGRTTPDGRRCQFPFHLTIPDAGDWYRVQVGDQPMPAVERRDVGSLRLPIG